ncbi:zinc metalloproteinase nas-4-like [Agrilus planipennis]|uniref:Metalloendopeptidase n=1 Tax=Agrilus planipennis TaxID=224129 RepID=A0A1W4X7Z9_AGRPL|nr:zinc metalloproteinase nas-4-like [Agrilus planipennis]
MYFVHAYIVLQIIVFVTTEENPLQYQPPEVSPALFEGDLEWDEGIDTKRRLGVIIQQKLWTNKTVPYLISKKYNNREKKYIRKAINVINRMTCIELIPRMKNEVDYLYFKNSKKHSGCSSYVGRRGGKQNIYLQKRNSMGGNCFRRTGTIIHEIMHSLGVLHEQSRLDRDEYITIHFENIMPGAEKNFRKTVHSFATSKFQYDINSIMHYGGNYFSIDEKKPTITAKKAGSIKLGQRKGMSILDCLKLNHMYGCLQEPNEKKRYQSICNSFGIQ